MQASSEAPGPTVGMKFKMQGKKRLEDAKNIDLAKHVFFSQATNFTTIVYILQFVSL